MGATITAPDPNADPKIADDVPDVLLFPDPSSGLTAARNPSPKAGEFYFDTTIGKPVWWSGTNWVLATGATA